MQRSADFASRLASAAETAKTSGSTDLLSVITDICRAGAERYRGQGPFDVYDLLAIEIISDAETMPHVEARKSIAARLRAMHGDAA